MVSWMLSRRQTAWQAPSKRQTHIAVAIMLTAIGIVAFSMTHGMRPASKRKVEAHIPLPDKHAALERPPGLGGYGCVVDHEALKQYNLTHSIHYARFDITAVVSDNVKTIPTSLGVPLPELITFSLDADSRDSSMLSSPDQCPSYSTTVMVPKQPSRADASRIIFGVATTYERLQDSLDAFAHWAAHTNTQILAVIERHRDASVAQERAASLGVNLKVLESDEGFNDRYFSLVRVLHSHRRDNTQWVSLIDDDTFFLSMPSLLDRLGKHDAAQSIYVGGLTEDFPQMTEWGFMAYGGAGIFLSVPLLAQLNANFDSCAHSGWTGDRRLAECIYRHTTTRLSWEHGLHQVDLHGDASGFFESGRPQPLSVHHWKSWFQLDMAQASAVTSVCGDACLFKRLAFSDGWFLNNGFSLVKYSAEVSPEDFTMEKTWTDKNGNDAPDEAFWHTLGPLRPKDPDKVRYQFEGALKEGGSLRQFYIDRTDANSLDRVVEVIWQRAR